MQFMNKKCYWGILFLAVVLSVCLTEIRASNIGKDSLFFSFDEQVINGTTGTPLGGFGCGGIKFDANTGKFSVMTAPPADAYDFKGKKNALLQLYTNRSGHVESRNILKASLSNGRPNDDAIWPLHKIDFGCVNGVQVNMIGISPLDNYNYDNMHLPYALYEVILTNTEDNEVTSSFAFQWSGDETPLQVVPGKGFYSNEWSVMAQCDSPQAEISISDDAGDEFLRKGVCAGIQSQSLVQKIAVKNQLKAGETRKIHFVLAWYNRTDPEIGYYQNHYTGPERIAEHGLEMFDILKNNARQLVERMRASNLPGWFKSQTLNTLANLVTNSMYKKDGRVAFAEGQWTCFGTMDQMWLARHIVNHLLPFYAWQELDYWARTQMKNGQIHHDFNKMDVGNQKEQRSKLVSWDDTEHPDYRNIQKWVDLNCGFIISVFELYRTTADSKRFDFLWPYVKKAAQRILDQVEQYGSKKYPFTFNESENSYDAGGNPNPYNASLSAITYKIMALLAEEKGENAVVATYTKAYELVKESFHNRYIKDGELAVGKHCESVFAGQWLAYHLKLGEIWSAEDTDLVLDKLDNYYYPYYWGLGYPQGTYDEWTPYILAHYGGLLLYTERLDQWYVMQKDSYTRQYWNRDHVFNHPLNVLPEVDRPKWIATNSRSKKQYISIPAIWRNYYDVIGFHRDLRTRELWIKPVLHESMNRSLVNAMFVTPEGYGSISYHECGNDVLKKEITVKADNPMKVSTLYLNDNFKGNVSITINGHSYPYKRVGTGYAKEIAVNWNREIPHQGIHIIVQGSPEVKEKVLPAKPTAASAFVLAVNSMSPYKPMKAAKADKLAGTVVSASKDGNKYVTSCNNFDYIQFSQVDFGNKEGATSFKGRFSGHFENSEVEIVLDDTSGTVLGKCKIPCAGKEGDWADVECSVTKVTGIHNIILRFYGEHSDNLADVDWIYFE